MSSESFQYSYYRSNGHKGMNEASKIIFTIENTAHGDNDQIRRIVEMRKPFIKIISYNMYKNHKSVKKSGTQKQMSNLAVVVVA